MKSNVDKLWQEGKFEALIMTTFLLGNKIFCFFYSLNATNRTLCRLYPLKDKQPKLNAWILRSQPIKKFMISQTKTMSSSISHIFLGKKMGKSCANDREYSWIHSRICASTNTVRSMSDNNAYLLQQEWKELEFDERELTSKARDEFASVHRTQNMKIAVSPERNAVRGDPSGRQLTHFTHINRKNRKIWAQRENYPTTLMKKEWQLHYTNYTCTRSRSWS